MERESKSKRKEIGNNQGNRMKRRKTHEGGRNRMDVHTEAYIQIQCVCVRVWGFVYVGVCVFMCVCMLVFVRVCIVVK